MFAADGPEAWRAAVEQVTGLSFDVAEIVDQERFTQIVGPLGDLPTLFPFALTDDTSGETFEAGNTVLSTAGAYRAITAVNGEGPEWYFDPARNAVWDAIADRAGAGIGALPDGVTFTRAAPPGDLDQFTDALFTAPVAARALESIQIDPERVAAELPVEYSTVIGLGWEDSVVTLRRGEVVLVFGSIAPARMAAPLEGPTIRLVSGYTDDDAATLGINRSDLLIVAIDVLLFTKSNVLSVVDQPGLAVPERTTVYVSDAALIDGVWGAIRRRVRRTRRAGRSGRHLGCRPRDHARSGVSATTRRTAGTVDDRRLRSRRIDARDDRRGRLGLVIDEDARTLAIAAARRRRRPRLRHRRAARRRRPRGDRILRDRRCVQPPPRQPIVDDVEAAMKAELGRAPVRRGCARAAVGARRLRRRRRPRLPRRDPRFLRDRAPVHRCPQDPLAARHR
ncbi:MAG: hypothetical protein R2697_15425 [Ilumatobacteraceae bacterium]